VSTRVPIASDLEALKRQEPDWERLRRLWTELEFSTLLRQLPAAAIAVAPPDETPVLSDADALASYLAAVPADAPIAVEPVSDGGPPEPALTTLGLFHPAAGAARLPLADRLPELAGRTLIGHDVKHLIEWWLAHGAAPPSFEDTAVAAYLLNPARTNYRLEEVAADLLGEGPGLLPAGSRARWIWELWATQPGALRDAAL